MEYVFFNVLKSVSFTALHSSFALHYPAFSTDVLLSSTVQRVIDSAHYFGLGYGKPTEIVTVDQLHVPVNWILPWESCPKFSQDVEVS